MGDVRNSGGQAAGTVISRPTWGHITAHMAGFWSSQAHQTNAPPLYDVVTIAITSEKEGLFTG